LTVRAAITGLLWAAGLAAVTFFNDKVMGGNELTGHFAPFGVFGVTVVVAALINPLSVRFRNRPLLSAAELSVATGIALFACFVPGRGLMQYFNSVLIMPHRYARVCPGWQGSQVGLADNEVEDWQRLFEVLRECGEARGGATGRLLWEHLPDACQRALIGEAVGAHADPERRQAILHGLNQVRGHEVDWRGVVREDKLALPRWVALLLETAAEELTSEESAQLTRGILDHVLVDCVTPRRPGPVESTPRALLTDVTGTNEGATLSGFVVGLGTGGKEARLGDIPWRAWRRPLLFWCPLLLALGALVIGVSLVVHRQWTQHEHLTYPTAQFLLDLLPDSGCTLPPVLRARGFWVAFAAVLLVNLNNYGARWWSNVLISVPNSFNFRPLRVLCPLLDVGWGARLFQPRLYFAAIGFAFLLSTEVSFSIGAAPWLYWLVVGALASYGVNISAGYATFSPGIQPSLHAGAYLATFAVLLYSGRRHYIAVLSRSIGRPTVDMVAPYETWGARIGLLGFAAFVVLLRVVGLPLWLGCAYAGGALIIYTVISRLLAEGGVFSLQSCWYPGALLWGVLGARFLGPDNILIMGILSSLLLVTYREALMGHAISALRLSDRAASSIGRFAALGAAAFALALTIAIPVTLYLQYAHGGLSTGDVWTYDRVPAAPYENDVSIRLRLQAQGTLSGSNAADGSAAFIPTPNWGCVGAVVLTFFLVLVFTLLRRRFPRWPFHPLLFLVMGTNDAVTFSASFLVGWFIKAATLRYGGWAAYRRVKPVVIGCIAGAMVAGVLTAVIGAVYYAVTGRPPIRYRVF
jgi:hypothetical protein